MPGAPRQAGDPTPAAPLALPRWRAPVGWLLGAQLIGAMKKILLFTMFGGRLDLRDWMHAEVVDRSRRRDGSGYGADEAYWFDFISDCGDGEEAMFSLAWVLQKDRLVLDDVELPRGDLLFVGGDTAYHVADWMTLTERFCRPFALARDHLRASGELSDGHRPAIAGIPGNHDYYDMLDGFNRQFRLPYAPAVVERAQAAKATSCHCIEAAGYERVQDASYVAVRMPHDWWLWGVDAGDGHVDLRQRCHFLDSAGGAPPAKLITATPTPSIVHGRCVADSNRMGHCFEQLGLERCFDDGVALPAGKCRLDLAGDVHHYARYGGTTLPRGGAPRDAAVAPYASVVSGLGGAFHHPSCTVLGPRVPDCVFPPPAESFRAIARRLLHPLGIVSGGMLWIIGAVVSVVLFLATSRGPNVGALTATLLAWLGVDARLDHRLVPGDSWPMPLAAHAGLALSFLISVAMLSIASGWTKLVYRWSRSVGPLHVVARWFDHPRWIRRYWPALVALVLALAGPWMAAILLPLRSSGHVVAVETSLLFVLGLAAFVHAALIAVKVGAHGRPWRVKLGFGCLGLFYSGLQLSTPVLITLLATTNRWVLVADVAVVATLTWFARDLATRPRPWLYLGLFVLCGLSSLAIPVALAGRLVLPLAWSDIALRLPVVMLVGAALSTVWLGWYLVVALGFSGHNNEAGAASRVDRFREFIRFRVEPDRLTAHVIGVGRPQIVDGHVRVPAWVIDRFAVAPAPGVISSSPRETP